MKILLEVLFLLMLSKFKQTITDDIEQSTIINDEPLRYRMLEWYDERNETKLSKKRPKRSRMRPKIESSCRNCGLKNQSPGTLIQHGDLVRPPYLYPWMVAMMGKGMFCTGSIINAYFILTASHCLLKNLEEHEIFEPQRRPLIYFEPEEIEIFLLTSTEMLRSGPLVERVIPHPQFKPSDWQHDIGLIKLKEKIICSKFASPICLPPPDLALPEAAEITIAGFGSYNGSANSSGKLREAEVKEEQCEKTPFPPHLAGGQYYCLKSVKPGQVACFGDSGGPMFYEHEDKFYILGVSSFGKSCEAKLPFLYTSVLHHLSWIHENIASSSTPGILSGSGKRKCNKKGRKLNENLN